MAMVTYTLETVPKPTKEDWERLDSVKDEDIDCSDMPEITDFSGFHLWKDRDLYRPVKVPVNCKLDADVVTWLKKAGKGYQTRMNAILRKAMLRKNRHKNK
ncbi:hypothetical protein AGMMS49587_05960 [Spirochaetia bacterium]|nr:hypothetical protein AGMMS49587_05960 [Spirochaetia bacterium]